jgi:hypothetical protein
VRLVVVVLRKDVNHALRLLGVVVHMRGHRAQALVQLRVLTGRTDSYQAPHIHGM